MSLSVVQHAVKQGKHSRMETAAMAIVPAMLPDAKCSLQNALNAAKTPRYRLNPARVDRYIAVIATVK
jgi:hypothetical protein